MPQVKDEKPSKDKNIPTAKQKEMKDFLKAKGHKTQVIDVLDLADTDKLKSAVIRMHGMTEEMYRQGAI